PVLLPLPSAFCLLPSRVVPSCGNGYPERGNNARGRARLGGGRRQTMQQVLFRLPIYWFSDQGIPIYGYGFMLFVAFVVCVWLACRLAAPEGVPPQRIQDLAIWLF